MMRALCLTLGVFANALPIGRLATAAETLDELLAEATRYGLVEAQENAAREKEFREQRDQQARLLAGAERERDAAEAESVRLSAGYDRNDARIAEAEARLRERAGNLGELFGHMRQAAADTAAVLQQSLISAQLPDRQAAIGRIAAARGFPSVQELEQLWLEMLREMTESARVERYASSVIEPSGEETQAEVVRVGPFTAVSGGRYLTYLSGQGKLAVLARQPSAALRHAAEDLQRSERGHVRVAVDPSRGVVLALSVERPTLLERVQAGEAVGYVILVVGLIGACLSLYQLTYLVRVRRGVRRQLANLAEPDPTNPLGRVLGAYRGDAARIEEDAELAELRISEAVLREVPPLERFQAFLRLAVAAGPLLGLIGTVVGMIITFQSITESGSSDPKLMAAGIGQAMIATVLGLGIAIPLLFANAGLSSISRQLVQILDEQSAGLLAESIESRRRAAS